MVVEALLDVLGEDVALATIGGEGGKVGFGE